MKKVMQQTQRELNVSEEKLNVQTSKQKFHSAKIITYRTTTYKKYFVPSRQKKNFTQLMDRKQHIFRVRLRCVFFKKKIFYIFIFLVATVELMRKKD